MSNVFIFLCLSLSACMESVPSDKQVYHFNYSNLSQQVAKAKLDTITEILINQYRLAIFVLERIQYYAIFSSEITWRIDACEDDLAQEPTNSPKLDCLDEKCIRGNWLWNLLIPYLYATQTSPVGCQQNLLPKMFFTLCQFLNDTGCIYRNCCTEMDDIFSNVAEERLETYKRILLKNYDSLQGLLELVRRQKPMVRKSEQLSDDLILFYLYIFSQLKKFQVCKDLLLANELIAKSATSTRTHKHLLLAHIHKKLGLIDDLHFQLDQSVYESLSFKDAVYKAMSAGDISALDRFIKKGWNPDASFDSFDLTTHPLVLALATYNDKRVARFLIEHASGISPRIYIDQEGVTFDWEDGPSVCREKYWHGTIHQWLREKNFPELVTLIEKKIKEKNS